MIKTGKPVKQDSFFKKECGKKTLLIMSWVSCCCDKHTARYVSSAGLVV